MSEIMILLNQTNSLAGDSMLDVGARDCRYAKEFKNAGFTKVEAFDPGQEILSVEFEGIKTSQSYIKDFKIETPFDVVVCRHVLPFTDNILENLEKVLSFGEMIVFTTFGLQHTANKPLLIDHNEVLNFLKEKKCEVRYEGSARYFAKNYAGQEKFWDVSMFIVKT